MTRTALNLCLAGCSAVAATWFAVSPHHGVMPTSPALDRPAAGREATADHLNEQAARLRAYSNATPLRPSSRNPFRFSSSRRPASAAGVGTVAPAIEPAMPLAVAEPMPTVVGIGERQTPQGARRTAVLTSRGQLYVVAEGESVAGRFTVATIDPDAVILRDESGIETRLRLR